MLSVGYILHMMQCNTQQHGISYAVAAVPQRFIGTAALILSTVQTSAQTAAWLIIATAC